MLKIKDDSKTRAKVLTLVSKLNKTKIGIHYIQVIYGTKYSGMDQVKFCLSIPYNAKFFKGRLPQISFGLFLNTLSHIYLVCVDYVQKQDMPFLIGFPLLYSTFGNQVIDLY